MARGPALLVVAIACAYPAHAVAVQTPQKPDSLGLGQEVLGKFVPMSWSDIGIPQGEDLHKVLLSGEIRIGGRTVFNGSSDLESNFHVAARTGKQWRERFPYEGDTFGFVFTGGSASTPSGASGTPPGDAASTTPAHGMRAFHHLSHMPDYASLFHLNGRVYSIVQIEDAPGATYLLRYHQDRATGHLTLREATHMDWSEWGGLLTPCSGMVSPWNTHVGHEEYEPNAKPEGMPTRHDESRHFRELFPYSEVLKAHPYRYGYPFEAGLDGAGYFVRKLMAVGRRSGELPHVMPDSRTVYLSDDGTNTHMSIFRMDRPGDFSSGRLFCARVTQENDLDGGTFTFKWIDMGHASDRQIRRAVNASMGFYDIFVEAPPVTSAYPAACPEGFTVVHTFTGLECLHLKPGMEVYASRLEARRYAAMLGCTTEWFKQEGFSYNPETAKAYLAMSGILKGMLDGGASGAWDAGTGNHIRLPPNACGCVYELAMDEEFFAVAMGALICGQPQAAGPEGGTMGTGSVCDENSIANPDGLTALPAHGALLIGEDSESRANNYLWHFDLATRRLQARVGSVPLGAEVASPGIFPDIGGFTYLTFMVQHPDDEEYKVASMGYLHWPRDCDTPYPTWLMPGPNTSATCSNPTARFGTGTSLLSKL